MRYVSDIASAKNPTTAIAAMIVISNVDIAFVKNLVFSWFFECKFIYLQLILQML